MQFIGRSGNEVLFVADSKAVIIDEQKRLVCSVGDAESMVASFVPDGDQTKPESSIPFELAVAATTVGRVIIIFSISLLNNISRATFAANKDLPDPALRQFKQIICPPQ